MDEARESRNSGVTLPDGSVVFASAIVGQPGVCAGELFQPDDANGPYPRVPGG
jgi:hypothetical protein